MTESLARLGSRAAVSFLFERRWLKILAARLHDRNFGAGARNGQAAPLHFQFIHIFIHYLDLFLPILALIKYQNGFRSNGNDQGYDANVFTDRNVSFARHISGRFHGDVDAFISSNYCSMIFASISLSSAL